MINSYTDCPQTIDETDRRMEIAIPKMYDIPNSLYVVHVLAYNTNLMYYPYPTGDH